MLTLQELDQLIINWSTEKGITNFEKQKLKFIEECGEMAGEILKGYTDKLKLEIGDVYVTLVILRKMYNKDFFIKHAPYSNYLDALYRMNQAVHLNAFNLAQGYLQEICKEFNIDLTECVNLTWNKIKDRKGETIDGNFFKK